VRTTKILSLSLPPELLREAERVAKKEGRTKSELFREALRRYIQERRWAELRRYGAQRVRELGIKETKIERVIEAYRKGR
jgi:CopG family transcriptional regulator/antitoxin EndoAI